MTTTTTSTARQPSPAGSPAPPATGRRAGDFTNVLRAELAKLATAPSTYWALLVTFAANIGFAVLAAALLAPRLKPGDLVHVDVVQLAMAGLHLSQVAVGVLGALIITAEYGTGMIRTTFAAVPRRRTVLAAKALVFTGTALVTATTSTVTAYLAFLAALPPHTLTGTALSAPGVARAVLGAGLYLTAYGLLGFGLGALLRSSTAAIATLLGVLFVPPLLLDLLPSSWKTTIGPYIPMQSGSQIFVAARREAASLTPWTGFGVFCLYAAVAVLAAFAVVNRRDA